MRPDKKEKLLSEAQKHAVETRAGLEVALVEVEESVRQSRSMLHRGPTSDVLELERQLYLHKLEQRDNLTQLLETPYFARCDFSFPDGEAQSAYFSKHSFPDLGIFSWTAPAAALRFSDIGGVEYQLAGGSVRKARLDRKDQYLMVRDHVAFMATEDREDDRTLIYQEKLMAKDRGFVLPDIVAQMEKAQDQVIRADSDGPLLISGPAGSGKTTLALHRVAYLVQSPDTAARFPAKETIVFVQDTSSKNYFGALLPDLGIHGVTVCTFEEWAHGLVGPEGSSVHHGAYGTQADDDAYASAKRLAAASGSRKLADSADDAYAYLSKLYQPFFDEGQRRLFETQAANRQLDRRDLTALLTKMRFKEGAVRQEIKYPERVYRGKVVWKTARARLSYQLVVIDEAENWAPDELLAVRCCVAPETTAVLYVGDVSQRTRTGTIQSWGEIGESFGEGRSVVLQKVYRNTRQVLEFTSSLGYTVSIPDGLTSGPPVVRQKVVFDDVPGYCRRVLEAAGGRGTVGLLVKDDTKAEALRQSLGEHPNLKVMTVEQAQGVEFETVVLVGIGDFLATPLGYRDHRLADERARVNRDLLYVALTRAMRELHVLDVAG